MARIRSIKPEATKSLTLVSWPREVRLAWHYLSMYLDDAGRGMDDPLLVKAECFPKDRDITERKMAAWLDIFASPPKLAPNSDPPLCRYEVDGIRYIHAPKFKRHQVINRPTQSRIPPCPIHESGSEAA